MSIPKRVIALVKSPRDTRLHFVSKGVRARYRFWAWEIRWHQQFAPKKKRQSFQSQRRRRTCFARCPAASKQIKDINNLAALLSLYIFSRDVALSSYRVIRKIQKEMNYRIIKLSDPTLIMFGNILENENGLVARYS